MIKTIQIDRFKSLRHTLPAEMGRVTLLTGANGRGKSSFCQALLVLSQTWRRGWMDNLLPNGVWKNLGEYDDIVNAFDQDKTIGLRSWIMIIGCCSRKTLAPLLWEKWIV